jgi:hypothetical protein
VTVYVDPSLGTAGEQNATDFLNRADEVVTKNDAIFGKASGAVSVIVYARDGGTEGTGGAGHNGCDFRTGNAIEVSASFGNAARVSALFEWELSECSMGGKLCQVSTGEALSRWCGAITSDNALADYAKAPQWAMDGMSDYVTKTDPTDSNDDSIGCGMAFISWLLHKGSSFNDIARGLVELGAEGTFAELYKHLTSTTSDPWPLFLADVQGLAGGVTTDDPFFGKP